MKVLINSRMRIRYAPEGLIVLEYRVRGFWGYHWKPVAYTLADKDEKHEQSLLRLQAIRLRKVIARREVVDALVLACTSWSTKEYKRIQKSTKGYKIAQKDTK